MKKGFAQVIVLVLILTAIAGVGYFLLKQESVQKTNTPISPIQETQKQGLKTFRSSSRMSFSIETPSEYSIEERFNTVTITTPKGKIYVDSISTNFDDLDSHLEALEKLNDIKFTNKEKIVVDGQEVLIAYLEEDIGVDAEKSYNIYIDNQVFSIFTKTESLYSDLDQIAKSFRYTGG